MLRSAVTALAGGVALCAPVRAATVVIWPVDPVIAADRTATALWLENRGDAPVIPQVRALGWDQRTGTDALTPQEQVVVSPPLARIAPGQRQMVRLVRRTPPGGGGAGGAGERAYRVLVDELPPPPPADAVAAVPAARLAVRMRYSIPLFAQGEQSRTAAPDLHFRVVIEGGRRFVELANTGRLHARITDLHAGTVGRSTMTLHEGLVGYVLAGATMRWPVPAGVPLTTLVAGVNGTEQLIALDS